MKGTVIKMKIERIGVLYGTTNCYIVSDEKSGKCAAVDPGGDGGRLAAYIAENGLTLAAVLLTHGHYDHTGGVQSLRENFPDVPVYMSDKDAVVTDDRRISRLFPSVPDTKNVSEGDVIDVGELAFRVTETPGHTRGGVCYIAEDCIFCGDTLFTGSMGRTDLFGGSDSDMEASLRKIAALDGDYRIFPGHMGATTLNAEREINPYLIRAIRK